MLISRTLLFRSEPDINTYDTVNFSEGGFDILVTTFEKNLKSAAVTIEHHHNDPKTSTFLLMMMVTDHLRRVMEVTSTTKQVTRQGFFILNTLIRFGGSMTPTELSKVIFRSKNATCRVISTLEKYELVTTSQSNVDGRSVIVKITPKGLGLAIKHSLSNRKAMAHQVFNELTDEETIILNNILNKLRNKASELIENP
jgi:DNA-binding MarR family transcriptional regulator